ncbi:MAG: hypothetical protein WAV72_07375 [Bradyrhizobium sp.]
MSILDSLFYAILSMDAYNRGYNAGLTADGAAIGTATLRLEASGICGVFLLLATPASAEQFSIKCPFQGFYYVTFDTDAGRAVYESPSGSPLKGRVDKEGGDKIHFHLVKMGIPDLDVVLDRSTQKLTWRGVPGDSRRQETSSECNKTELRPILSKYDNIAPY